MSEADPVGYVQAVTPEPQQKDVIGAIGKAKYITENKQKMMQAWDDAANQKDIMKGHPFNAIVPYAEGPAQTSLDSMVDPVIREEDGRINPAVQEGVRALYPHGLDLQPKREYHRSAFEKFVTDKLTEAWNTAKGGNVDLSKFSATNPDLKGMNWAKRNLNNPDPTIRDKAQRALKLLRR
jgi:hypothetical protein